MMLTTAAWAGVAWALPSNASAELVFSSDRCAQGGQQQRLPVPPGGRPPGCVESIWRAHDDGSGLTRLTDGGAAQSADAEPSWSPDGTRIAFVRASYGSGGGSRIWVMNADGSNQRRLSPPDSSNAFYNDSDPTWSPTGLMLAFDSNRPQPPQPPSGSPHIWLINRDGSGLHALTSSAGSGTERVPRFSLDGLRVTFLSGQFLASTDAVQSVSLAGIDRQAVTRGTLPLGPFALAFSPDGQRLALTIAGLPYVVNADGTGFKRLSTTPANELALAAMPPALFATGPSSTGSQAILQLALDGSGATRQITDGQATDAGLSWTLGRPGLPVTIPNLLPPTVGIPPLPTLPAASHARSAASDAPRLPYIAIDASGIRWVHAAVARLVGGGCRFRVRGRFTQRQSCGHPRYFDATDPRAWRAATDPLPAGRYRVWFRAADTLGNTTRRPRPIDARLR